MSADKRTVHTDALATLGTIIESGARDAIHLAVEPVLAAETLYPGQDIGIIDGKASTKAEKKLGIVDPFINGFVPAGKMFWLIVYPRQITSLRHVWEHPDFDIAAGFNVEYAKHWMRELADSIGYSYDKLMRSAKYWVDNGEYLVGGAEMEGENTPDEFWDYYEIITGERIPTDKKGNFFSCAC